MNTNADTIASEVAIACSSHYKTTLCYLFEKAGVLSYAENNDSVIPVLSRERYTNLKNKGAIHNGMIPKLDNAFRAIDRGVAQVIIAHASGLTAAINGEKGTLIQ